MKADCNGVVQPIALNSQDYRVQTLGIGLEKKLK
jgi:hypothetical protein